ncbi:MAG TPA: glycosyltransferase family 4 protein [Methylomusa anaerophila]|uniref:GDP-mannose-dependent alpha-(1-2)-phosphatidylinositol mannosyltransferase n=1 Tax=Methylomusa anaerophila TaxID=1930071 RepID=A0A348AH77_9FIRM|nr:glycosyltransferase family 4 protein [Methylomusa anaerophila]BBB90425.1 GDP-mannose-dependent alpha-(1-2)-phosphatidylinositol mannosyltransferase [Methylomusa anaerophila]HML90360.1 glycosyltransferase family 4 protein [Methylomusa anaerophila]
MKPKILVANPFPIFPAVSGGQRRVFYLFKYIASFFDVVVLCFGDRRENKEIAPGFRQIIVPKSPMHCQAEIRYLCRLRIHTCAVISLIAHHSPEYALVLSQQAKDAAIIVLSRPYLLDEVCKLDKSFTLVYDAHNVEYVLFSALLPFGAEDVLEEIRRVEGGACRNSRLVTACSPQDAQALSSLYSIHPAKILAVPNGADTATLPFISSQKRAINKQRQKIEQPVALFIGSYHPPNLEAGRVVVETARRQPGVQFFLLGSVCEAFKQRELPGNVRLLGIVSEQEKHRILGLADIALNPMLSGSGTNIKMLDYMAAGIPVITTEFGARGINGIAGEHFLVAGPQSLSAAIDGLLADTAKAELIARQAFSLVNTRYSWRVIAAGLADKLTALCPDMDYPAQSVDYDC